MPENFRCPECGTNEDCSDGNPLTDDTCDWNAKKDTFVCNHAENGECLCDEYCEEGKTCDVETRTCVSGDAKHNYPKRVGSLYPLWGKYRRVEYSKKTGLLYAVVQGGLPVLDGVAANPDTTCKREDAIEGFPLAEWLNPAEYHHREFCDEILHGVRGFTPYTGPTHPTELTHQFPHGPVPINEGKTNLGISTGTQHKNKKFNAQAPAPTNPPAGWRWELQKDEWGRFQNIEDAREFADQSTTDALHVISVADPSNPVILDRIDDVSTLNHEERMRWVWTDVALNGKGEVAFVQRPRFMQSKKRLSMSGESFKGNMYGRVVIQNEIDPEDPVFGFRSHRREYPAGEYPVDAAYSPDGKWLAVVNHGIVGQADAKGSVYFFAENDGFVVSFDDFAPGNKREFEYCLGGSTLVSDSIYHGTQGPSGQWPFYARPVSVAWGDDCKTAFVSLGVNNAIAVIDVYEDEPPSIFGILCLGMKDFMDEDNKLDTSMADNTINLRNFPLAGAFQPDGIAVVTNDNDDTRIFTANSGFFNVEDVKPIAVMDISADQDFDVGMDVMWLQELENAGQMWALQTNVQEGFFHAKAWYGVGSEPVALQRSGWRRYSSTPETGWAPRPWAPSGNLIIPGGRSVSAWDFSRFAKKHGHQGLFSQVWDSGSDFEAHQQAHTPRSFNSKNGFDDASTDRGPRPGKVLVGDVGGVDLLFVTLQQGHSVEIYGAEEPFPYVGSLNHIDTSPTGEILGGDVGPYDMALFNRNGCPYLVVTFPGGEGNLAVWELCGNVAEMMDM
eukprot:NODE_23_length_2665_cov_123.010244_g22_i0.p1 GENE.NODE_23_length_2665_cov_123.010244_g22_i0~~NODE_23_length_2665_cov_123.010244_g22_i0.p1  ORF type:complete len:866 (+),score=200.18 NODE_23_length_2665_cov_123.010244_g22_i0:251-2599(+)